MNENQVCQSQVHVTARWYLIFKPRKRGLNSWLRPVLLGHYGTTPELEPPGGAGQYVGGKHATFTAGFRADGAISGGFS
jgi:hypothetical protein